MSVRRKRAKSALPNRQPPPPRASNESFEFGILESAAVDSDRDYSFPVDSASLESGSFASRCSARLINEVVSKFDSAKRDLVKSTGFQSILQFPAFKQINRKFALWLLSCVDETASRINIGDHISIRFSKADVSHVLGIPACGKTILDVRVSCREAKERVLNELLPYDFKEYRSIKVVQEVIERSYDYPMSQMESDRFRVAFVVFVVSNLLAPSAKYDYACVDYWNAIQDPDGIGNFDWSEYVIARLLEGVTKLKQDISSNIKYPNITGCSIFLQVLYLDSIYLEGLSSPHNTFPRVVDFSYDKIVPMIQADRNYAIYLKAQRGLPVGKLRDPLKCIYSWADEHRFQYEAGSDGFLIAIWEGVVAMVHLLRIPLEAAGPVFVALADYQDQLNSGLLVNGMHALKIISVVVSIMIPYSRGFSYQSSYCVGGSNPDNDVVATSITKGMRRLSFPVRNRRRRLAKAGTSQSGFVKKVGCGKNNGSSSSSAVLFKSFNENSIPLNHELGDYMHSFGGSVIGSLDDIPHKMNINLRVATVMSQFYRQIRQLKPVMDFDLNSISQCEISSPEVCSALSFDGPEVLPSPWELGYIWGIELVDTASVFDVLKSKEADESFVILHRKPKHIQVSLQALCEQILGNCELETDLMDALTRSVTQEDDDIYSCFGKLRWRLYFESDLMEGICAGSFDLVDVNLWSNLRLPNSPIWLSKSNLLFFPALLQCSWVCFTWNIEDNVMFVFEPRFIPPVPDSRVEVIQRSASLLKIALQTLSRSLFRGIDIDATYADVQIITLPDKTLNRSNRTGVLCGLFFRCFDGNDLNPKLETVHVDAVAAKLLKHLVSLRNNLGSFPATFNWD